MFNENEKFSSESFHLLHGPKAPPFFFYILIFYILDRVQFWIIMIKDPVRI